jgi:YVTN family beta-propeller protein
MTISRFTTKRAHLRVYAGRISALAASLLLIAFAPGCGEIYRPIAQPLPGASPSPAPVSYVYAISDDGIATSPQVNSGAISRIDVSGDSVAAIVTTGLAPVHGAITPDASKLYVANSGEDTISAAASTTAPATTIDLPQLCDVSGCAPSSPVFVQSTENAKMYVANEGNGTVAAINTATNTVFASIAVNPAYSATPPGNPLPAPDRNSRPVALAETPNGQKIYSVNQGNNTVTSINTSDDTIAAVIPVPAPPIWAVASSDSAYIFVLDQSGSVSVIATASDSIVSSVSAGAGSNFIFYDQVFNRLFVTNPATSSLSIFDSVGSTLSPHASGKVTLSAAATSGCTSALHPESVTVLGDGSRAYVASYQADSNGQVCTQVDIVNAATALDTKTLVLPPGTDLSSQTGCSSARFRVFAASSSGSVNSYFKVYVSQCDAGSISVIDTFATGTGSFPHGADVLAGTLAAPVSSSASAQVSISAASASGANTTYSFTELSGPNLQVGMSVAISGMTDAGNNGSFIITAIPSPTTFTVTNQFGVTTSTAQSGGGTVVVLQNPVFMVAEP